MIVIVPVLMGMVAAVVRIMNMRMTVVVRVPVGAALHRRLLARLEIEDRRRGLVAAPAMAAHHAASIISIDLTISSSP